MSHRGSRPRTHDCPDCSRRVDPCTLMKSVRVECRGRERFGARAGDAGDGCSHQVLLASPDEAGVAPPVLGGGGDSHHFAESGVAVSTIIPGVPLVIPNLDDVMVRPAPPIAPLTSTSDTGPGRVRTTATSFHCGSPDALKADLSPLDGHRCYRPTNQTVDTPDLPAVSISAGVTPVHQVMWSPTARHERS